MNYTLIKGTFHVIGYSPDGDSMMFKAENPALWAQIATENRPMFDEKLKAEGGAVQLRLQAIDALETHYTPEPLATPAELKGKEKPEIVKPVPTGYKQPAEIGKQATEAFMRFMGVQKSQWKTFGKNTWVEKASLGQQDGKDVWLTKKQTENLPGYIVAADMERNGRPLSWVFAGAPSLPDGATLNKDQLADILDKSVNYQLLKQGLVYPYFFMTLAGKLRDKLLEAVKKAQTAAQKPGKPPAGLTKVPNVWIHDKTAQGVKIATFKQITDEMEVSPYLFRKLIKSHYAQNMNDYWEALKTGTAFSCDPNAEAINITRFFSDGNPWVFIISDQDFVRLDEVVALKDGMLKMTRPVSDFVFLS